MQFEFTTSSRVLFGNGKVNEIGQFIPTGSRVFLVHGNDSANADRVKQILEDTLCIVNHFVVQGEPTPEMVQTGVDFARCFDAGWVISVGGGSAIDAGKAIAGLITNPGDLINYLDVIGAGKPLVNPALPMIAIPTTAGTGSEVTRNAVLSVREKKIKVSLRSPFILPRIALVDPELSYTMPPMLTANTGMDAIAQVLEPFVSNRSNPLTDLFCQEGLRRASRSLVKAYQDGNDVNGREDMAFTSLLGGFALANAGLGAVHGFAASIGGMYEAAHGAICAKLLPTVVKYNVAALMKREPESQILAKYQAAARLLTQDDYASISSGISWLENLIEFLQIPSLGSYGISESDIPILVANAAGASSMKANPIQLSEEELTRILFEVL